MILKLQAMLPDAFLKIAERLGGKTDCAENPQIIGVGIDSRKIRKGEIFVALEGESFDGHDFLAEAENAGAAGAIVGRKMAGKIPQIVVENTVTALQKIAREHRKIIGPTVVAMTGSNGKTTTKNMLTAILSEDAPTLGTRGNFNNHIGVPLTLLKLEKNHRYAVVEMGANHLGEIENLCTIAKPDVALITNIGSAHLGAFGSAKNLLAAKSEIYAALGPDGVAVIDKNSPHREFWRKMNFDRSMIFFGAGSEISAHDICHQKNRLRFILKINGENIDIALRLIGAHNVHNALAASACAVALGISPDKIRRGLEAVLPERGRLNIIKTKSMTIIDDSYNANPQSMRAALQTLGEFSGEKVAVLGSMAELGEQAAKLHREVGDYAKKNHIDAVYAFGDLAKHFGGLHFEKLSLLAEHLKTHHNHATVLIKASRTMRLERLIAMLQT